LLIGNIGDPKTKDPLCKRLSIEEDIEVKRNIKLALAKLGDTDFQKEIGSYLGNPDERLRYRAIEDLKYINDKRLTKLLLPSLDDTGRANLVSDKSETTPRFARICDAAVTLVAYLCNNPFSFEVSNMKIYSAEEIEQAKEFLSSLKD
ncbi:MAG: HEAT repeat domain-containing protein, partial [candidate division Zixibacteria bacterium]|nr:HEAT repeat domain-containing protein [candidate division Zixibacteria bacterium]